MISRNNPGRSLVPTLPSVQPDGFSLIEIMVVLVIVGLVLSLIVLHKPMRSRSLEAQAAARDISQTLRAARAAAIASNRPVVFTIDPAQHIYDTTGGKIGQLPKWLSISAPAIQARPRRSSVIAIRFAPDGSSSGGGIELGDRQLRISIGVDWLTGRVKVDDVH